MDLLAGFPSGNYISICSGVGGLDIGFGLVSEESKCVLYTEREAHSCAVLVSRMQEGVLDKAPIYSDITSLDATGFRGKVRGVIGGPPCQAASIAGRRKGKFDERWLWGHTLRIVRECHPDFVFFENVSGLLSGSLQVGFEGILGELQSLDFKVATGLFTAEEVGAPHKRERVFILGVRRQLAYSQCAERREGEFSGGYGQQRQNITGQEADITGISGSLVGTGDDQVVAQDTGPQGRGLSGQADDGPRQGRRDMECLFPPGPNRLREWTYILRERPELAPAVAEYRRWHRIHEWVEQGYVEADTGGDGSGIFPGSSSGKTSKRCQTGKKKIKSPFRGVVDGMATELDPVVERRPRLRECGNGVLPLQAAYAICTLWASINGEVK